MSNEDRLREYLKRVTADLTQVRQRLRAAEAAGTEPIAIIGMACRYPGGVDSPEALWKLVSDGTDAISGFPADRGWDLALFDEADSSFTREGGFLHDVAEFDPALFGISPREALAMDPQQRLVLEASWEAIERAGVDPYSLRGSRTGVFTGVMYNEYASRALSVPEGVAPYLGTGSASSVVSGRVAYTLGLEGPAVTIDTACSSSLVALHLAGQALRSGECGLALAGGVSVMVTPNTFVDFGMSGGLAADGRCKSFSAAADGAGWSEGVGILLLARLSDAVRNGHPVLALVTGSAVNSDGASSGLTVPNGPSQQRVIRQALANARLSPADVDVVEAHGTGTSLGDPIEAQAVLATYGRDRPVDRPLWLGSLKSNIGHTQAAAGVGGIIKMVLAMRHGTLPRTLHVDEPTPHVDWTAGSVSLLTQARPWPETGQPRRAAVSSFGVSGTNAHVVIEQVPTPEPAVPTGAGVPAVPTPAGTGVPAVLPWVLSGRTAEALRGQAGRLAGHPYDPTPAPVDVGYSLVTSRAALPHRAVVLGPDTDRLTAGLTALAQGREEPGVVCRTGAVGQGDVVFVFPGQGSQWVGMAAGLLDSAPVFAARIVECERALRPYVDWSLREVLRGDDDAPSLDRVDVVQPMLWAVMVSLAELWRSVGVVPAAVLGHSQGEIAAAVVGGGLSLDDGARIVALRSLAVAEELSGAGGMVSLALPRDEVAELIAPRGAELSIAAVNGPRSTVVSGTPEALEELLAGCAERGQRARRIPVDYASHSAQVERIRERLLTELAGISPRPAEVPLLSTVTGQRTDTGLDAGYWYENLRRTVGFESAVRALIAEGRTLFLEVSAHPVLTGAVGETIEAAGASAAVLATLRRDEGGQRRWLTAVAEAYVHGVGVDWAALFAPWGGRRVDLPTYAFQRRRYWLDAAEPAPAGATTATDGAPSWFWDAVERGDLDALTAGLEVSGETPLNGVLSALSSWHRRDRERGTVESWRYRLAWRPVPYQPATPGGTWLVAVPAGLLDDPFVAACLGVLTGGGATVVPVALSDTDSDRGELAARLREQAGDRPLDGVLSLLALAEQPRAAHPGVPDGLAGTLALLHALRDLGSTARVWCLTRGAVSIGSSDPLTRPTQALVWGFGRVAAHEYPAWGGLVDVAGDLDHRAATRLGQVLAGAPAGPGTPAGPGAVAESQVAIRASGIFVPRLVRAGTGGRPARRDWTPSGTVLVTGGTGAIGTHVARWLARRGAEHLLLVSRRGLDAPGAADLAAELTALGTGVTVVAADPADRDALAGILAAIPADRPLTAVFHAAGVVDSSIIDSLSLGRIDSALRAKRQVADNLHELTRDLDLSAFVLFSSLAGIFGAAGEGNYGPGNAYLDALAQHRAGLGLPATSIVWGSWDGAGMAQGAIGDAMARHGIPRMAPELALAGLQRALDHDDDYLVVADVDWNVFPYFFRATQPSRLLDELAGAPSAPAESAGPADTEPVAAGHAFAGLSDTERNRALLDLVREQVRLVLGYDAVEAVEPNRPFLDLGLSSAGSVELRNRLTLATGLRIPATIVFDHPSSAALARYLDGEIVGSGPAPTGGAGPTAGGGAAVAAPDEAIAIIAMSCRFPGGVESPEDLWALVRDGVDAMVTFPDDRGWNVDALYDPDPDNPGTSYAREGAFIPDVGGFDPDLFGISPREALAMDPQQRLLLEASWQAFERAGIDPTSLRGSRTAVYAGTGGQDYPMLLVAAGATGSEGYLVTGGSPSVVSGRVAYTFGLEGPAVTVDTACSSSLVALHLAGQALRSGECDLALAGGVTVMSSPAIFTEFSRQRGMAFDGRCKSFSATADGTGWGEGVGMLLVERLSDALRNGHPVLAVVRGSAVNSDGASNGLTAPNGAAQQRVIGQALAGAGLGTSDVDIVEAHGTGTTLGDPIEAQALLATYGQGRTVDQPLWLGSVKSNIGHTQAAAGVAGVIKMVMALRHAELPRTLHVEEPTPHVDWSSGAVSLLTRAQPWPDLGRPRRAAVSSFGISGTNAHTILEAYPTPVEAGVPVDPTPTVAPAVLPAPVLAPAELPVPVLVSAASAAALVGQAGRLADWLAGHPELAPVDVGLSLVTGRADLDHRAVVLAADRAGLLERLEELAAGQVAPGTVRGEVTHGRLAMLFTGQGAQRAGMGRDLYAAFPVFADAFDAVCAQLDVRLDRPLANVVFGATDDGSLDLTGWAQAGLFAVEVALFRLWESWGVRPDVLLGHSIGEVAAAHVAGVLSLPDACALVAARGGLMQSLPAGGAMLAVQATEAEVVESLAGLGQVDLAAVNGPSSVVLSGDGAAIAALEQTWRGRGRRVKRLAVSHAFHSPLMEPMLADFAAVVGGLTFHPPRIPIVSTVTGALAGRDLLTDPGYWVDQVRQTVRFAAAVDTVVAAGVTSLVELGPDGVLCALVDECVSGEIRPVAVPSTRAGRDEATTVLTALSTVYTRGIGVDWPAVYAGRAGRRVDLPTYAFHRRRFWPDLSAALTGAGLSGPAPVAPAAGPSGVDAEFWTAVEAEDLAGVETVLGAGAVPGLDSVVPALSSWWRRSRDEAVVRSWRYQVGWQELRPVPAATLTGRWLVAAAGTPDESVLTLLSAAGARVLPVPTAGTDRAGLADRIAEAVGSEPVTGALWLTGQPEAAPAAADAAGHGAGADAVAELLVLVQALGDAGVVARLWCVTRAGVPVDGTGPVRIGAAGVWGLGRVAALELPDRWAGLVDVPVPMDAAAGDRLLAVLAGGFAGEDQVAVRESGVWGRRLRRAEPLAVSIVDGWAPSGTVLVTGGTGGVGRELAWWLVGRGARRLVLVNRSGPAGDGVPELVAELGAAGCTAVVVGCDVSDRARLAEVLARHPVSSVFHAAGVTGDGVLAGLDVDGLAATWGPKVSGAVHLDELTRNSPLDAFVVFGSWAGVVGGPGQGGYAAANAALHAVVAGRRRSGLVGSVVAWGAWAGAGMAADPVVGDRLRRGGVAPMAPERALAALGRVVDGAEGDVLVADVDWSRFVPGFAGVRSSRLFADIAEAAAVPPAVVESVAGIGVHEGLPGWAGASADQRRRLLVDLVRSRAAMVLGHGSVGDVGADRAFRDLGVDSLTAVELRNVLGAATGLVLPAGVVFDYPTPRALADFLYAELAGDAGDDRPTGTDATRSLDEPVAIVGMGCRFPGGVGSPAELWELLVSGGDAMAGFPTDRGWDLAGLFDGDGSGTSYARQGGFLSGVGLFDAGLFGISPREALAMDPQQRMLLELCWEVFEAAGLDPTGVRGSRTGVFVGTNGQDYGALLAVSGTSDVAGHVGTGNAASVLSGRVAYAFGLHGPAVTVDTACSSSLVALHQAVQSLRSGECDLALAGGVTVMATPGVFVEFSEQKGLAFDGRCKAFGAGADGTGWGEGVGMLLVERLSDARRNGHRVLAVVRGSAVNSDGASNGLTAPNGPAQQRVIGQALVNAGLRVDDVDAVEAHGTGTTLGDPIEAEALLATYGRGRSVDSPLYLGSIKSNVGHTQAAAGVAGIIKMVLALRHQVLPRTLHADEPTPHVDWSSGAIALLNENRPWPATDRPRRAGISSFGVSGTNAHTIIEEAPAATPAPATVGDEPPALVPWVVSGRSPAALRGQAEHLLSHLNGQDAADPVDIGWSLVTTRAALEHRAVVVADDRATGVRALAALAAGQPDDALVVPDGDAGSGAPVFVFPGQGSQWAGMAADLLDSSEVFRQHIDRCGQALAAYTDWSLTDVLRDRDAARLDRVDVVQPALWAVHVALAGLWRAAGVHPSTVVGHSQGEIAAAVVAGALSLDDGARVVALRSRAIAEVLSGLGGMGSVALPPDEVTGLLAGWSGRLSVAALNGPESTVVSGDAGALDDLLAECERRGVRSRRIPVDYASHSVHVERIRDRLLADLAGITPRPAEVPFHSTVTGTVLDTSTLDAGYWYDNLRRTVRLDEVVRALIGSGVAAFVEVSAHPVLAVAITGTVEELGVRAAVLGTLRRDEGGSRRWLTALAEAYVHGVEVDWSAMLGGRRVDLPTYAFDRRRYWPQMVAPLDGPSTGAVADPVEEGFWAAVERADADEVASTLQLDPGNGLSTVLPALTAWRRGRRVRSTVDSWRYQVAWRPLPELPTGRLSGTWLVVLPAAAPGDPAGTGELVAGLRRHGADVLELRMTGAEPDRWVYADLLLRAVAGAEVSGVLSLLAVDDRPAPSGVPVGLAATVALAQALGDAELAAPLWCATRGAVAVTRAEPLASPAQALVWGLGRSVALEEPRRFGGLVDLPATLDTRGADRLAAMLAGADEDQIAVRPTGVFVRRLHRAPASGEPAGPGWTSAGPVLVTGGTGAIGTRVARWLAGRGVTRLVLTSRRGPDAPGAAELVAELSGLGASVTVVACDVADRDAVAALLAEHPVTAVVHAAGVARTVPLAEIEIDELAQEIRGKVAGAVNLHELTRDRQLDGFVLFSSIAGVWGSGNQAGYAAANAYLDALAQRRRADGLAATSVSWGAWAESGMAARDGAQEFLSRRGLGPMDPQLCVSALAAALDRDETCLTVADVDWSRFAPSFTAGRPAPLIGELPEVRAALREPDVAAGPVRDAPVFARDLAALVVADRAGAVLDLVRRETAAVLGYPDATAVAAERPFKDLGVDSLTALGVRNRVATATGLRLPATLVFDHPTPAKLAGYLLDELTGTAAATGGPASAAPVVVADEPIAIVSMSCRYSGGIGSPEQLWDLVAAGGDAMSVFPTDRGWQIGEVDGGYSLEGGFVYDAAEFDAGLFGISPREALAMDPQQRLLLETSWEAFERAGLDPHSVRGSTTGVYVGASSSGYGGNVELPEDAAGHALTGSANSVISGRVAYAFGLEGPAVTVDTACSSSLVALHLATSALRAGECAMALVAGVTIMVTPAAFVEFKRQNGLAVNGRCKSFAAGADGTGWGEGVGVLLVERLSDAVRNGHRVLALVRGSAVNSDGASNGLTAPNGPAQQRVIRRALAAAGVDAGDIDTVEAHGTGTTLGDPIEAQALLATYGRERPADRPLWLGSVKSNIGHTQAASGVAGVIKMVMAMRHRRLPKTLHVDAPTPHVDWTDGSVALLTEARDWPAAGGPRRAAVSSFGISGTNAHTILEQAPDPGPVGGTGGPDSGRPAVLPWLLSARSVEGLRAQAARLLAHDASNADPVAVGRTLATTRAALGQRGVVLAGDAGELRRGLADLAAGRPARNVLLGTGQRGRTAMLFSGQGAQRAGMGRELHAASGVFADALDAACAHLDAGLDVPLLTVLSADPGSADAALLDRTVYAQAGLFAVEVALYRLLESWGIVPDQLLGHSIGELAAAHVAGVLSLPDACTLVAARGRLMQALPAGGAMLAVELSEADAIKALAGFTDRVDIAAVNGPTSVVVSGDAEAIAELEARAVQSERRTRRLAVSHAFHSARMDAMLDDFGAVAAGLTYRPPVLPIVSGLLGAPIDPDVIVTPDYWVRQVRGTVRFADGMRWLSGQGVARYVEVGPGGTLTALAQRCLDEYPTTAEVAPVTLATLAGGSGETEALLYAVSRLHVSGGQPDWRAVFAGWGGEPVDLPTYAFERERYWLLPAGPVDVPVAEADSADGSPDATADGPADDGFWAAVEAQDAVTVAGELGMPGVDALGPVLPALSAWRRRRKKSIVDSWRYRIGWHPIPEPPAAPLSGRWLLVRPADDPAAGPVDGSAGTPAGLITAALRKHGAEVVEFAGSDAADRDGWSAGLRSVLGADRRLAGVVSLLALSPTSTAQSGEPEPAGFTPAREATLADGLAALNELAGLAGLVGLAGLAGLAGPEVPAEPVAPARGDARDVPAGLHRTLLLAQALGDLELDAGLWCLTSGAVSVGDTDRRPDPEQAQVWGLGRVAALETPRRWGGLVDLPSTLDARGIDRLLAVLAGAGGEDQVAIRAAGTFARRLQPAPPAVASPPGTPGSGEWRPHGTVLVTGGTGALGRRVARWLATHGARHLVLLGRRGPATPGIDGLVAELTSAGTRVTVVACDVADRNGLAKVLADIPADLPLTAVLHLAGVSDNTALAGLTPQRLAEVLRPKMSGAWHLDELTRELDLSAFVLFSSVAAVWGSGQQGAYAAANSGLDALAAYRRAAGRPATSVAWGPWADDAGISGGPAAERLGRLGLTGLAPEAAMTALARAVGRDETCVTVADVDWPRFVPAFTIAARRPLLSGLPMVARLLATRPAQPSAAAVDDAADLRRQVAQGSESDAERLVLDLVRRVSATVLGHRGPDRVDPAHQFLELGFDSLTGLELRDGLRAATGLDLPGTLVFDHTTPAALARFLRGALGNAGAETGGGSVTLGISPQDRNPVGLLNSLYREAARKRKVADFLKFLGEAAKFRPVAPDLPAVETPARLVRLAEGTARHRLICCSGTTAVGGPHEFSRLAQPLRGRRDVLALPVLGYGRGELLPATMDVALDWQAEAVLREADDQPYVLFGHSGGGVLAHALARRLEARGAGPAALVLADVYPLNHKMMFAWDVELSEGIFDRGDDYVPLDDIRLTAMAWYGSLFWEWEQVDVAAKTMLVRASEPLGAVHPQAVWRSTWQYAHTTVDVPGNHLTMMVEHAESTALAVHQWMEETL